MLRLLTNRRVLLGVLIVGVLVAIAVWPRAIAVEMTAVTRGPLLSTIDEEGETRVRSRFVLTAPVSGEVLRIALRPGDPVTRNMRVATVRAAMPMPLDARTRAEAEAALNAARAAFGRLTAERARAVTVLDRVQQQTDRARHLAGAGAVSREELEAREADLAQARDAVAAADFAVAQAQHEVDAAAARLEPPDGSGRRDYGITSPVDGVVLRQYRESQSVVPAGEPLLDVGDPADLEIVTDLLSADAVSVQPGADVLIERWGGPDALSGHVRRVEPSGFTKISALGVEEQRVNVLVDFDATAADAARLGDGFRVDVRIVTWRGEDVLRLPAGALFRQGADWAVFRVAEGRASVRVVEIGHRNDTEVEVTRGLEGGDTVVLFPPDTLNDGDLVEARTAGQ